MASVRHLGLFPWCLEQRIQRSTDIVTNLEIAMAAWWRVKKWRFSINYSGSWTDANGNTFSNGSLNTSYILQRSEQRFIDPEFPSSTINKPINNEYELVCDKPTSANGGGAFTSLTDNSNKSPNGSYYGFNFRVFGGDSVLAPVNVLNDPIDLLNNSYLINCYFQMSPPLLSSSIGSTIVGGPNFRTIGQFTFSVLGTQIAKPIGFITNLTGTPNYSCIASIEAYEYWSYTP